MPTQTISPTGVAPNRHFGSTTVVLGKLIRPSGINAAAQFGTPRIVKKLAPAGIAPGERFGTPRLELVGQSIFPGGIASTLAIGSATVSPPGVIQYVHPVGWTQAELTGAPTLTRPGATAIHPTGIPPS